MRKLLLLSTALLFVIFLISCNNNTGEVDNTKLVNVPGLVSNEIDEVFLLEERACFDFFYESYSKRSSSYGLSVDRGSNIYLSSIASTGYFLSSLVIGANNGWIDEEEAKEIAIKTLNTVKNIENYSGFYYHFLSMLTGIKVLNSEVSIIDTALLIMGAISAGEYFGGEAKRLSEELYQRIDWNFYLDKSNSLFYMGYDGKNFYGHWDTLAEQLMLYVLAAGSKKYSVKDSVYKAFVTRIRTRTGSYVDGNGSVQNIYLTYKGELFLQQYSHSYIYFKGIKDPLGVDYWDNAAKTTESQYRYALNRTDRYNTYKNGIFGISASDGPFGYKAYGSSPCTGQNVDDGTVAPFASLASLNYLYQESLTSANAMKEIPNVYQRYGFISAFNLGRVNPSSGIDGINASWFSNDYIGIDKGNTIVMIENYRTNLIWNLVMSNENIQLGLGRIGFKNV